MSIEVIKRDGRKEELNIEKIRKVVLFATEGLNADPMELEMDAKLSISDGVKTKDIQRILTQVAVEKTTVQATDWQFVGSRLFLYDLMKEAKKNRKLTKPFGYEKFYELVVTLTEKGLYGKFLLENYSKEEIEELERQINPENDLLFTYPGLKLLADRYLVTDFDGSVMELPQERFMIIAMHLAMNETEKMKWAKKFYWALSNHYLMTATPTLANAGTPRSQLSSCFIDTVDDSLWGIYHSLENAATNSKWGGGIGTYWGHVRSRGSSIQGFEGVSGGVIPFLKSFNQTAVSVDQLGTRSGAISVYLDAWHLDILEFLDGKLNNGDERLKFHDLFPAICMPNIFYKRVESRGKWTLFDPHEVKTKMGFVLEDTFGDEFEEKYLQCEQSPNLKLRKEIEAIEIMKRVMKSAFETGGPFIFNRDTVNYYQPNPHVGNVYSSNLCTEIAQVMSPSQLSEETLADGRIVRVVEPGNHVICNLNSLNLSRLTVKMLQEIIPIQIRMLDNVIDHNFYPVKETEYTNKRFRAIGAGVMGYHDHLVQNGIRWESEEHLEYADELYNEIAYHTIKASMELAKEKGAYPLFEGSEWHTGSYFKKRDYTSETWKELAKDVAKYGIRNSNLMAVAPTGSISVISGGASATTDPIFKKYYVEEKKGMTVPVVPAHLDEKTFFLYKEAHTIDQLWSIKANAVRARHIDQAQSFNLYIKPDISAKEFLNLYLEAWKQGVRTIYYTRTQIELYEDDCVSCT
jgi:ribonucleoside-diphosphate reductase alpha chain